MSEFLITKEELSRAQSVVDRSRLECIEIKELLDNWVPVMEDVVKTVEDAYRASFKLLKGGNLQNEPQLNNLRQVLISMMAELQMVKGWRASCCNMSSDKECRVLDREEDKSEGKVLKEGSEANQSADQQADCGKIDSNTQQADCGENKICRCESCDVCYYQWKLRHE